MKVLNALKAADYTDAPLYKYVKEAEQCIENAKAEKKRGKASTLYHLSKFLVRGKHKH